MRTIIFCIIALASFGYACDLDKDGFQDSLIKVKGKRLKVFLTSGSTKTIKTPEKIKSFSCNNKRVVTNHKSGKERHKITVSSNKGGINSVCTKVRGIAGGEIWKSIGSNHFPPSDPRRYSTSYITRRGTTAPSGDCISVYAANGKLVSRLGVYARNEREYSSRFYGATGCGDKKGGGSIASAARKVAGTSRVYITSNGKNCAVIPNPASCYNSSQC